MTKSYDIEAYILACDTLAERGETLMRNHADKLEEWQIDRVCAMFGKATYEAARWREYAQEDAPTDGAEEDAR